MEVTCALHDARCEVPVVDYSFGRERLVSPFTPTSTQGSGEDRVSPSGKGKTKPVDPLTLYLVTTQ